MAYLVVLTSFVVVKVVISGETPPPVAFIWTLLEVSLWENFDKINYVEKGELLLGPSQGTLL